jgi:hypothetical protein
MCHFSLLALLRKAAKAAAPESIYVRAPKAIARKKQLGTKRARDYLVTANCDANKYFASEFSPAPFSFSFSGLIHRRLRLVRGRTLLV